MQKELKSTFQEAENNAPPPTKERPPVTEDEILQKYADQTKQKVVPEIKLPTPKGDLSNRINKFFSLKEMQ